MRACVLLLLVLAGLGTAACGTEGTTREDRTRTALLQLFAAVRAEDDAGAAARLVYSGEDPARRWKTTCSAAGTPEEQAHVAARLAEVRAKVGTGALEFLEFQRERQVEGEWLAWRVKTATGTHWFACLEIDGRIALGDID